MSAELAAVLLAGLLPVAYSIGMWCGIRFEAEAWRDRGRNGGAIHSGGRFWYVREERAGLSADQPEFEKTRETEARLALVRAVQELEETWR